MTTRRKLLTALGGGLLLLSGCSPRPRTTERAHPPASVHFSDITEAAGLSFIQSNGGCGLNYFPEQVAAGAALLDANGDGFLDVYFPAPKPLGPCKISPPPRQRLYLNDGHGHFALAPNAFGGKDTDYGIAAAVGDYDNDGRPDLYVCCAGRNTLYHNRGDGTFEDVTKKAGVGLGGFSTGAAWFDADGDGRLDLYVARYCEWTLATDIPCPGPDGKRGACNPTTYTPSSGALFHNNGDGTFTDVTNKAGIARTRNRGLGVAAADLDGDGRLDLFCASDIGANLLYHNKGGGTFEDVSLQQGTAFGVSGQFQANMGIAVGDPDGDGRPDVLVTTFSGEPYTLYHNDGGYFTDASAQSGIAQPTLPRLGFGAGFLDSRNSGVLDVFFANGHVNPSAATLNSAYTYKQRNQLLLGDGAGHFTEAPDALPSDDLRVHRGAVFGDVDNDGRVDILVTADNNQPTLLHNDSPPAHWLTLRLVNKQGCVTPVGACAVATVAGRRQTRAVLGGGSYGGDSNPRLHFGLGTATKADVEIHWLSGAVQTLRNVPADRILTVREGQAPTS